MDPPHLVSLVPGNRSTGDTVSGLLSIWDEVANKKRIDDVFTIGQTALFTASSIRRERKLYTKVKRPKNMKSKTIGLIAVSILFVLAAAGSAFADGISSGGPKPGGASISGTGSLHADVIALAQAKPDILDDKVSADFVAQTVKIEPVGAHVLWSAKTWRFRDAIQSSTDSIAAPEPSSLFLLAVGLTSLVWFQRRATGS